MITNLSKLAVAAPKHARASLQAFSSMVKGLGPVNSHNEFDPLVCFGETLYCCIKRCIYLFWLVCRRK